MVKKNRKTYITKSTNNSKKSNNKKRKINNPSKNIKKINKKNRKKSKFKKIVILGIILFLFMKLVSGLFAFIEEDYNKSNGDKISNNEFISKIEEAAIVGYKETGILPSITISQAILESNWGRSKLAIEGKNLFGIKADPSWNGKKINFDTKENYNDYEKADFRKYSSWDESIKDYHKFLINNTRYHKYGLFKAKTYRAQAQALENAGYATTINSRGEKIYADKLISVIESRNLYEIDKKVKGI